MQIQSLSVCVPAGCPNNCKFCVSKMHRGDYTNQIEDNKRFRDLYKTDYKERLAFARDNGCNTLMFTGDGEPMANQSFIEMVGEMNKGLEKPFRMLELQTSGVFINDESLRWMRNDVRINTISLSLSSLFDDDKNAEYNGTPNNIKVDISHICSEIKRYDFNLRLSLNMTDEYNNVDIKHIFKVCKSLGADQITFRKLYTSGNDTPQDKWINNHQVNPSFFTLLNQYIMANGRRLERLPFGAVRYSIDEMSVVVDDDCMSTSSDKEEIKYLILRENCKLYTKWDDKGSLLF